VLNQRWTRSTAARCDRSPRQPQGVQGGISDGWQITIPGSEAPGTYLVVAPGQKAPDDVSGYTVRHSPTFNIFLGARLTDEDPTSAKQTLSQLKMYPYAQRDNPPPMDILDVGTRPWSGGSRWMTSSSRRAVLRSVLAATGLRATMERVSGRTGRHSKRSAVTDNECEERPGVANKTSKKSAKVAKKATAKRGAAKPTLLAGGNPQIAKADGDAPVQAYIAAIPGWKRDVARRLDALIVRTVPDVRKAVKWNSPFYGIEGQGWFLNFHCFTKYVKVAFFRGTSLRPLPPGESKQKEVRYVDIHEDDRLDEAQMALWIRQAAALPGWK
jgi:hypothetical protein